MSESATKRSDPERMRELGRRGGKASGEARRKRGKRGFIDAARALVSSDLERLVEQLASSPAGAVKLAALLERHGVFEPPEEAEKPSAMPASGSIVGLIDVIRLYVETGQEHLLGLTLTEEQRRQVLGPAGRGLEESAGSRVRQPATTDARAPTSTSDDDDIGANGGGGSEEIDGTPAPSGSEESVRPSWARPPDIYADAATQAVHRQRVKRGQPTGNPNDVYRDAGDRL